MTPTLRLAAILLALAPAPAYAAKPAAAGEEIQSDISMREISIQSNFTGIEILIFGSVDFSHTPAPDEGAYDVIMVIRSPGEPMVARRKERVAGIWVNGAAMTYSSIPGFYAVLATRPLRAITSEETLKSLGIGIGNLDFVRHTEGDIDEETFRSAVIKLKEKQGLFQEIDDGVTFIGRSLFRASVDLPVNVPIGHYTAAVYLFRDGALASKNESTLEVNKVGFERLIYLLAFRYPVIYGLLAVVVAVLAGLLGWVVFRRE
jgi:uncharacterized protein (TIGR02186 family)